MKSVTQPAKSIAINAAAYYAAAPLAFAVVLVSDSYISSEVAKGLFWASVGLPGIDAYKMDPDSARDMFKGAIGVALIGTLLALFVYRGGPPNAMTADVLWNRPFAIAATLMFLVPALIAVAVSGGAVVRTVQDWRNVRRDVSEVN